MYFNNNGKASIVSKEVIDQYLNQKRKGNIIYCLRQDNNYFAVNETFDTAKELNIQVSKYMLRGFEVHYHEEKKKPRGN